MQGEGLSSSGCSSLLFPHLNQTMTTIRLSEWVVMENTNTPAELFGRESSYRKLGETVTGGPAASSGKLNLTNLWRNRTCRPF